MPRPSPFTTAARLIGYAALLGCLLCLLFASVNFTVSQVERSGFRIDGLGGEG